MFLKPLRDLVVVEMDKPSDTTASGLYLPANAKGEKTTKGRVVSTGPGLMNSEGKLLPMTLKSGDTVLISWGGTEVEVEGKKYRLIKEDDIMAVVD